MELTLYVRQEVADEVFDDLTIIISALQLGAQRLKAVSISLNRLRFLLAASDIFFLENEVVIGGLEV